MIYAKIAPFYDEIFPPDLRFVELLSSQIAPGATLLDLGCGNGSMAMEFFKAGINVTGIDLDAEMVAEAQRKNPDLIFHQMNLNDLDRIHGCFDGIYCIGNVVSYLQNSQKVNLLKQIYNLLSNNGLWISQMVNWDKLIGMKQYYFPDKSGKSYIFTREYRNITNEQVAFRTEFQLAGHSHSETAPLYPVLNQPYLDMNREAGFLKLGYFGDFLKNPYNLETSAGIIHVFRKSRGI